MGRVGASPHTPEVLRMGSKAKKEEASLVWLAIFAFEAERRSSCSSAELYPPLRQVEYSIHLIAARDSSVSVATQLPPSSDLVPRRSPQRDRQASQQV